MGLLQWLGLEKPKRPPIPTLIVAGLSGSGRKALMRRLLDALGSETKVGVILYDAHVAAHAFDVGDNATVHAYAQTAGGCSCHGSASTHIRQSAKKMAADVAPDAILLQVGRGHNAQEVLQDLLRLRRFVSIAGMTVCLRADSSLNELRDAQDDLATYVRAAGQVLFTRCENAEDWMREKLRNRVAEFNRKAFATEDEAQAAENMKGLIEQAKG